METNHVKLVAMHLLLVTIILLTGFCWGNKVADLKHDYQATRLDTIVKHDTVAIIHPVAQNCTILRFVAATLPFISGYNSPSVVNFDTLRTSIDSVAVSLPIQQKVYTDSLYTAWVSGYDPSLDSLRLHIPTTQITVRTEAPSTRRWGIGLHAGYGITSQGMQPYIGIGVSYNILAF